MLVLWVHHAKQPCHKEATEGDVAPHKSGIEELGVIGVERCLERRDVILDYSQKYA